MSDITAMGYAIVSATVDGLVELTAELAKRGRGGARNLLDAPEFRTLAASPELRESALAIRIC